MSVSEKKRGEELVARLKSPKPEEYWDGIHTGSGDSDSEEVEASQG